MRVAIIADTFPPLRTSGAVQLRDLSNEFARQGHETTVLIADPSIATPYAIENNQGVTVARLKTPKAKDVSYLRRTLAELVMPFAMMRSLKASPLADRQFDAVIWYSPTIFLGPVVRWLKKRNSARSYLILRDIFPQWAADMGIISRGPAFHALNAIANYQYRSADIIGVQSAGNIVFFASREAGGLTTRLEVLHNWLAVEPNQGCSIDINRTHLAGRYIFVYAGNMGTAQHIDKMLNLANSMQKRQDVGFLFVGRGSEVQRLRKRAIIENMTNVLFEDEIDPAEIPGLYAQCHVGMICLDVRHRTHNIPGKFLTYLQSGLPVLASINPGNDLQALVEKRGVGRVSVDATGSDLPILANLIIENELRDTELATRCQSMSEELFSTRVAVNQIVHALTLQ